MTAERAGLYLLAALCALASLGAALLAVEHMDVHSAIFSGTMLIGAIGCLVAARW